MTEYAAVKSLPDAIQAALKTVSYAKADVQIVTSITVTLASSGDAGRRGFATLVNLTTGNAETVRGSWGGQNMFNRTNPVDNDHNSYPLPDNGAAIVGSTGYGGTYAVVHIPASMRAGILPAAPTQLTTEELDGLYAHKSLKSGPYRKEYLARKRVTAQALDALVTRGLLKRNAAGATSITTEGKNAVGDYRGY